MTDPVRVGLVGAGPWARIFTAPLLAAGTHTVLTGIWARRLDAAEELAGRVGTTAVGDVDELFAGCDAVAFAVPPDVQADLGARAAQAGRALLLDKPVGLDLAQAEHLAGAIATAGVPTQLLLTTRYLPAMRTFLAAEHRPVHGGRVTMLGDGALPGTYFGTPWRLENGALLDLGPHVFDAAEAALGPVVELDARGDDLGVVAVTCRHASGTTSQLTLSATTPVDPGGLVIELYGRTGRVVHDPTAVDAGTRGAEFRSAMDTIAHEFAEVVRSGRPHALDVHRGVALQRLIERARADLHHLHR